MKAVVYTLGCKINQYETRGIIRKLVESGFSVCEEIERADIYVLNTCAVTMEAERKSRQCISKFLRLNPDCSILVLGCASQNNKTQFKNPNILYVGGTASKIKAVEDFIDTALNNADKVPADFGLPTEYEDVFNPLNQKTRDYIKVQDGCDNFCSYCIVPYLRGRSRSRSLDSIKKEVSFSKAKEIVLTGINLSAYGRDIGTDLAELIQALSSDRYRIRLGSLEAGIISKKLLTTMQKSNVCPHFHLSLQSGSDETLKAMNRRYTAREYLDKVELIRSYFKNPNITTDIIAGFPLESLQAHKETIKFMHQAGFGDAHIFPYSERKGTKAETLKQIDKQERLRRAKEISEHRDELKLKYIQSNLGQAFTVLTEEHDKEGTYTKGYTENYLEVFLVGIEPLDELIPIRLDTYHDDRILAKRF